jgi:hypothetical protein
LAELERRADNGDHHASDNLTMALYYLGSRSGDRSDLQRRADRGDELARRMLDPP